MSAARLHHPVPAPHAAAELARFAADLDLRDVPADVIDSAKACIADTVAVAAFGSAFPWSQAIANYVRRYGAGGPCRVLGLEGVRVHAPFAALANGAFAHAFEQDSLRKPGAGVHPGATLLPPALAMAEECGASGARLLTAFIAACEVMFRIGDASLHSAEERGFHAPGLTGPYGATIAAGIVMGQNAAQLADALGIAGSLSGGLLAFTKASRGAAVKRLHLGRAAESGVLAARLAAEGFAGPETVLEGRFGFLESFCAYSDATRLTEGLGTHWETRRICIKAYACHVTAHTPVESLTVLMGEHGFTAVDVATISIAVSPKVLSHHDIRAPADVMQVQYSVPFCVALALHRDIADPRVFEADVAGDPHIIETCRRIELMPFDDGKKRSTWCSRLDIVLKDGRRFSRENESFTGTPERPLVGSALRDKFMRLVAAADPVHAASWFDQLATLESTPDLTHLPGNLGHAA